jgi:hypothetical protein
MLVATDRVEQNTSYTARSLHASRLHEAAFRSALSHGHPVTCASVASKRRTTREANLQIISTRENMKSLTPRKGDT